jgi:hypothetical protein
MGLVTPRYQIMVPKWMCYKKMHRVHAHIEREFKTITLVLIVHHIFTSSHMITARAVCIEVPHGEIAAYITKKLQLNPSFSLQTEIMSYKQIQNEFFFTVFSSTKMVS